MEQILINLIAGAIGGTGVGKASPNFVYPLQRGSHPQKTSADPSKFIGSRPRQVRLFATGLTCLAFFLP
jgi:hypothetical protein